LENQKQVLERQIADTRLERPNSALVQAHWKLFTVIWEKATEGEKNQLMPLLVERVEMTEKERGFCRLTFQPQIPRSYGFSTSTSVVVSSKMGAVLHEVTNYPDLYIRGFAVPRLSRKRT